MRSGRRKQIMTLSILLVAVLVISVGFAAFSTTLKINTNAIVNPDASDFKVVFSSSANTLETNPVNPNPSNLGEAAIIDNTTIPTISGISVNFEKPGDSATYTFYVRNEGQYVAFLNSITIRDKTCIAEEGTSDEQANYTCDNIMATIGFASGATSGTWIDITGETLRPGESKPITVTIHYYGEADIPEGPVIVEFGDISMYYATQNGMNEEIKKVCMLTNDVNSNKEVDLGDEVTCGTETFYVLPNDSIAHPSAIGDNITLLAKYNLNVGNDTVGGTIGIQNSGATGYLNDNYASCNFTEEEYFDHMSSTSGDYIGLYNKGYGCKGTMPFSTDFSWGNFSEIKFIYDSNSLLYLPVENYKSYMKGLGVDVKEASLGSYSQLMEAFTLSATQGLYSNFNFTNFWLGSAITPEVYYVTAKGTYSSTMFWSSYNYGVRPIIVIPLSEVGV